MDIWVANRWQKSYHHHPSSLTAEIVHYFFTLHGDCRILLAMPQVQPCPINQRGHQTHLGGPKAIALIYCSDILIAC